MAAATNAMHSAQCARMAGFILLKVLTVMMLALQTAAADQDQDQLDLSSHERGLPRDSLPGQEYLQLGQVNSRQRRQFGYESYVGKGRIKPYKLSPPKSLSQSGENKKMPRYFRSINSTREEGSWTTSNKKYERIGPRNEAVTLASLSKLNNNLVAEVETTTTSASTVKVAFQGSKNRKTVGRISPRRIVKGGKIKKTPLKGVKPRKQKPKFDRNQVAKLKARKGFRGARTSPSPHVTTTATQDESS